jgi:hypothetical protein
MHEKTREIIQLLPSSPKKDQGFIRAAMDKLHGCLDTGPAGPLYDVLIRAGGKMIPYATFTKSKAFSPWLENEKHVLTFIHLHWPDASKVTLNSLKHFLFAMLADDLIRRKIRVTVGTLALNAGDIPAIFDQQFPGYLSNGLAPVILMSLVSKNGMGA